jgi:hypothetical protein
MMTPNFVGGAPRQGVQSDRCGSPAQCLAQNLEVRRSPWWPEMLRRSERSFAFSWIRRILAV